MTAKQPLNVAILVSGNGSNLQAIIDRIEAGEINARIVCVVSNNPDAYALTRAARHDVPTVILDKRSFSRRHDYDTALVNILEGYGVQLVVLAGFMQILTDVMIDAFPNAIINIHPALLPAFPGLNAQKQALDYGVRFSGCTVHFVDHGTDTGPIILQAVVPVMQDDSVAELSKRIQKEEHRIFPEAIRFFAESKLSIKGRQVRIDFELTQHCD